MRIFYIGPLSEGSTCLDRMRCIESLGHEVIPFDIASFSKSMVSGVLGRFNFGPLISDMNHALYRSVSRQQKVTHIWIDKGRWIWPETLERIMKLAGAILIHYTPDAAILFHKSRHFTDCIPKYDLLFTTKPYEVELYLKHGAKKIHLTHHSFEKTRFYPRRMQEVYDSDVTFIGHYERHYASKIRLLSRLKNITIKIWGPGWVRYARTARWCKPYVQGDGIWGEEYPKAISSARICLGLLSKLIPDTITTRTFEIPACGGFMLAERTNEHKKVFKEGKEAAFFDSDEELLDKAQYYLSHSQEREEIAAAGRERCLKSGYSNHDLIRDMLMKIEAL